MSQKNFFDIQHQPHIFYFSPSFQPSWTFSGPVILEYLYTSMLWIFHFFSEIFLPLLPPGKLLFSYVWRLKKKKNHTPLSFSTKMVIICISFKVIIIIIVTSARACFPCLFYESIIYRIGNIPYYILNEFVEL